MRVRNYLVIIIGIIICSISFSIFFSPYQIISGGLGGIAIIFKEVFGIKEVISLVLLSMMFLIIGCLFLNREEIRKSLLGTVLFPLFVYLFSLLFNRVDLSIDNNLLTSIVGGVSLGFGLGLIYREGHFIGGLDLLNCIIEKKLMVNYSIITLITDSIVIIAGGFVFGFETFIYSAIAIFIYRLMIDKINLGIGDNRSFYIITSHAEEIKKMIINELGHGATILKGKGAYTNENRYIIFAVIPKKDYYKLRDGIKKIDSNAFFVVSSSYEVGGGK